MEIQRLSKQGDAGVEDDFIQYAMVLARHEEDLGLWASLQDQLGDFAAGQIRHDDVREKQIDVPQIPIRDGHGMAPIRSLEDGITLVGQDESKQFPDDVLVVRNEHGFRWQARQHGEGSCG